MRYAWVLVALLAVTPTPVLAQDQPAPTVRRFDVYFGYQGNRVLNDGARVYEEWGRGNGLVLSFGWNVTPRVALVVDDLRFGVGTSGVYGGFVDYSFLAGPRVRFGERSRLTPFVQLMAGAFHTAFQAPTAQGRPADTRAQMGVGGGLELRVRDAIALRLAQINFRHVFGLPAPNSTEISAGVVVRFGKPVER